MKRILLLSMFFCGLLFFSCQNQEKDKDLVIFQQWLEKQDHPVFSVCIQNGLLYDGVDTAAKRADILIQSDSIAFIGRVDTALIQIERLIDAEGKVVCPGFIDAHAHGDPLRTPAFSNFLAMGVTTITLGQDGSSPATTRIRDWMDEVADSMPGVNIALLAGHGTLRHLSGVGYETNPAPTALDSMKQLLKLALADGCYGLSTGLEYTPGVYAGEEELEAMARIVGEEDGVIMSHVRNEDDDAITGSLQELFRQGQYARVHASHLKVVYGKGKERAEEILQQFREARKEPYAITADVYPYTASYTGIGIVFPDWAKPPHDYVKVKTQRRAELLRFLQKKVTARNGPEATLFGTQPYAGKTLAQLSREQNRPFAEILLDMGPSGASAAYFVMDETLQAHLLSDPQVMIGSDGSPSMRHPRGYGSFPRIIQHFVLEEQIFPLGEAIRKMTSLTAQTLGLPDRGALKPGFKADLLVFDPKEVRAEASFERPHQPARGFDWVFVNGKTAAAHGQVNRERYGKMLRKLKNH